MEDLINNRTALRWAVALTFGLVLTTLTSMYHWQFYALLFLLWLMDRDAFRLGVEEGVCIGVKLPASQRNKILKVIDEDVKDEDNE